MTDELYDAVPASAHRKFGLARDGATEELAAQVGAGPPVELTNDRATCCSCWLLTTTTRTPSALDTAAFFGLPAMAEPQRGSR